MYMRPTKKKIGPIAQKLGSWVPIQNFNYFLNVRKRVGNFCFHVETLLLFDVYNSLVGGWVAGRVLVGGWVEVDD